MEVEGRGRGGRVLRNRIIVHEEVVAEAREEVGGREVGERVLRNRKRQEEIVTEAWDEVGGRGAGGRVLRNRKRGPKGSWRSWRWRTRGRVLRKRKRQEEVVVEAREEGSHQAQPREEEEEEDEEAQLEALEEAEIVAPVVCRGRGRGRGRGQRQREVEVGREDEGEDDDLQLEAAEDDDLQSEVEAEDDDLQDEVESQEDEEESQAESQEDEEESHAESEEEDEESNSGDDEVDDGPLVGPQDRSLLKDFRNHVAAAIWGGMERKLLKIYNHSRLLTKWELPKTNRRFMDKVKASGLLPLAGITYKYSNNVLVSAFVERWHPETNSFHFRFGEMAITLDDVPYLIGVPVEGLAVHAEVHGKEDCVALLRRWLGVTKKNAKAAVFCGDLSLVSTYGWGVGALGFLYRQLGQASRCHVKRMGGYGTLLEAWIQEHFSMFRHAMNLNYMDDLPRAARWQSRRQAKSATTVRYREMLDDVQATQVIGKCNT
ncbi:hypothetical protein RHGRI_007705 [Rhododendron griersonianum]|uniref:Aminotransferase-like plant mobile domain-containing protein n=1 Tax=Rhododendron griersonianum TaxID=479676 RepID=A0AAV6KYI9_9ERIC|nr:hypothetical protein RHGRI_007705 [Rhododendron griersonianum]